MNNITNGNSIPNFEPNVVPIFEPNQVLKNTDLNSIVTYLDSHNRLTRTHLIGMGIVYGLEVQASVTLGKLDEILITAGCGITSEGFFVQYLPSSEVSDQNRFTHYRNQQLNKNRLIPSESKDEQYQIKELITAAVATANPKSQEIQPLTNLTNLAQQVVLILCDWDDQPRDSCLVDCDDRGRDRNFRLRFFLIDKSATADPNILNAEKLIRSGFALGSGESLRSALHGWFEVPDCHIDRLVLSQITNFDTLMTAYYRVCKDAILSIDAALQQTHTLFSPFISTFHPTNNAFANLQNQLKKILIALVPIAIANANPFPNDTDPYVSTQSQVGYGIQYFYDYLVELVTAFNELKDAIFDLMDECSPNMHRFPKYLLAGLVVPSIAPCDLPDIYRHSFYQPPIYNGNQLRKREVRHLYERLVRMSNEFTLLPFYQTPVKITPSRNRQALLGEQAIPYYYSYPDLYTYWNYDACRKQRASQLPAYFRLNGLSNQRGYDLIPRIDWADFFRVEGHLGLPLTEAIEQIKSYKDDFNLAFDLVVVRVGEGIDDPDLLQGYFDDLEMEFDQIKADWQQKYAKAKLENKNSDVLDILENFDRYFFQHPDLTKIDSGLMENDFLEQAKEPSNYEFRPIESQANAFQLVLNINKPEPFRTGLVTNLGGNPQIPRTHRFIFTNTTDLEKDKKHIREIFAVDFTEKSGDLQVEIDDRRLFRFVISYGQENIELSGDDLEGLWIRVEDENPYTSTKDLIARYHDFDALFTFLQYFGNRDQVVTSGEAERLVSYYEFRALFNRYLLRLESVMEMQHLKKYAKHHRGLEHLGGVPKGGTLVLVYTSDSNVVTNFIKADSALNGTSDEQVLKIQKQAQFPFGRLAAGEDRGKTISSDRINKNVVIADFSLPYLCCSAYSSLNYVVSKPKPFISLPQPVYCEGDEKIYDFILEPPGGLLKGGDGIVDHNGNYAFQPSTVDADVTEPMNLTFFYIVDGVGSSYSILLLPHAEIRFSIFPNDNPTCIHTGTSKPIRLNAVPDGGKFRMAINDNPDQEITVTKDNEFDLNTIPFPSDQNVLRLSFRYIVPNTDDYCGGRSEPQELILLRQPKATIDYDRNQETGEAIGTVVYNPENCKDLRLRVKFRNIGSEADTYEWKLNGTIVPNANSRDVTLEISYNPERQAKVVLIARNRYGESETTCSDTDQITVVLSPLNRDWWFDNRPKEQMTIVLCHDGSNIINQESLTVAQAGGTFKINPKGLLIALKNSNLPCDEQKEYTLSFATSGSYTITYTLPDGKNSSRQVEVAIVPVGNFTLDVRVAQVKEVEGFTVSFTNIQPTQEELSKLECHWEITIGNNPPIITKEANNFFAYNGDRKIRLGDLISVVMKLSNKSNGICTSVSEPKTSQVPMEVTKLELYRAVSNEDDQIEWQNIGEIEDGSNFVIPGLGEVDLNIRAITTPSVVGNVVFVLNIPRGQQAPKTTPDELAPYDLYRNSDDTQVTGWKPRRGTFMLTASPFQQIEGQPYQGNVKQVKFTLQPRNL